MEEKDRQVEIVLLVHKSIEGSQENIRYLYTNASHHMCGKIYMFVDLDESISGNVSFGDDSRIPVKGKCKTSFRPNDGRRMILFQLYTMSQNMKNNI